MMILKIIYNDDFKIIEMMILKIIYNDDFKNYKDDDFKNYKDDFKNYIQWW